MLRLMVLGFRVVAEGSELSYFDVHSGVPIAVTKGFGFRGLGFRGEGSMALVWVLKLSSILSPQILVV